MVDNASEPSAEVPRRLANGLEVRAIRLGHNAGAAGRNVGADAARGSWLMMLDDDSAPVDGGFVGVLERAPADVGAVGAEIRLAGDGYEVGGLPEVFVGCGAAVRADVFREVGGYDAGFGYYGEEYDLCARILAAGWRVAHHGGFRVEHRRSAVGRDLRVIVRRLVRNEGVVAWRYAPDEELVAVSSAWLSRRRRVAEREGVMESFAEGERELARAVGGEVRRALTPEQWARFVGRAAAREGLAREFGSGVRRVAVEMPGGAPGKNVEEIERALRELGAEIVEVAEAEVMVVGTLAPGPTVWAREELRRRHPGCRVVSAWSPFTAW